jgi:hypothetical protein
LAPQVRRARGSGRRQAPWDPRRLSRRGRTFCWPPPFREGTLPCPLELPKNNLTSFVC